MNRVLASGRGLFVALGLCYAALMFGVGTVVAAVMSRSFGVAGQVLIVLIVALVTVLRSFAMAQFPRITTRLHWLVLRPVTVWEFAGLLGFLSGIASAPGLLIGWLLLVITAVAICPLAAASARGGEGPIPARPSPFFLFARGHFDDWSSRRHLLACGLIALLASNAFAMMLRATPASNDPMPPHVIALVMGMAVGSIVPFVQVNPIRGLGFLPWGMILIAAATIGHALAPVTIWPAAILGLGAGLPIAGLLTALLMLVPPTQRFAAMLLAHAIAGCGASLVVFASTPWVLVVVALIVVAGIIKLYFREFVELIMEVVYWPMYRFTTRGPGIYRMPTRGPTLIIANHAAFFDPLFLCKVLPVRVRAMMISTMFDRPFLKWLAGDVYGAIRVADGGSFRRETPELDEAIAVLKQGQNVMIFPEGWLRRREEKPIHRFAQGVYRILRECPDTPVIPCWIENSWGSYLSYKDGPPAVNKKFDMWYRIRLGIGEPVVLPPEMLADQKLTRRHLMQLVLNARTHLGLPAYPMPDANDDEKTENGT